MSEDDKGPIAAGACGGLIIGAVLGGPLGMLIGGALGAAGAAGLNDAVRGNKDDEDEDER